MLVYPAAFPRFITSGSLTRLNLDRNAKASDDQEAIASLARS
jgi:hypothetical protein